MTLIGPMCGVVKLPQYEDKEIIQSWSKDHTFYTTIGGHYCSCKAFEYGDGEPCKHLVAKTFKPRVHVRGDEFVTCEIMRSMQHLAGVYNFLATFNFPVWVLDRSSGSKVYLFKTWNNYWMISEYYENMRTRSRGIIRTKYQYPNSILPPLDFWNQIWEVWSPRHRIWISADLDFGITKHN